jgi:hypothetical protein
MRSLKTEISLGRKIGVVISQSTMDNPPSHDNSEPDPEPEPTLSLPVTAPIAITISSPTSPQIEIDPSPPHFPIPIPESPSSLASSIQFSSLGSSVNFSSPPYYDTSSEDGGSHLESEANDADMEASSQTLVIPSLTLDRHPSPQTRGRGRRREGEELGNINLILLSSKDSKGKRMVEELILANPEITCVEGWGYGVDGIPCFRASTLSYSSASEEEEEDGKKKPRMNVVIYYIESSVCYLPSSTSLLSFLTIPSPRTPTTPTPK